MVSLLTRYNAAALVLAFLSVARLESAESTLPVISTGERKAELIAGTGTSDGRFALAWTLRPLKSSEPVDWSLLEQDREKFRDNYSDEEQYFVEILVVDQVSKKSLATLKLAESWSLPGIGHEALVARWGPRDRDGRRFAIVNCDRKWSPQDLVLIEVTGETVSQRSLLAPLNEAVLNFVAKQSGGRPASATKSYVVEYPIFDLPELGRQKGFSDPDHLWLPFEASAGRNSDKGAAYAGVLHLNLASQPDGPAATIQGSPILSVSQTEEPVSTDVRFLDEDHRLNQVYEALRIGLSAGERERLKKEEREWINKRNGLAQSANGEAQETSLENPTTIADRELVNITQARITELEQWRGADNYDEAIADFDRTLKLAPKNAAAFFARGDLKQAKGDNAGAIADYDRCIELEPKNAGAYHGRGDTKQNEGDTDAAIADYNRCLELEPANAAAYNSRASSKMFKGDDDGAIADYNRAIELDPDPNYYFNRTTAYIVKRDWDSALADIRQARELDKDDPDYPTLIWLILAEQGQNEAANKELAADMEQQLSDASEAWTSKMA
ncbi:MAG TPA: tetratricopeptide repeat protein, partial [Chthoniobacterales bacterium]|nr:tetratricopeptide repeat protein [Chthoniobacterales bacterium]